MELFYITNNVDDAVRFEKYGVDRIFVDTETIGKDIRQSNYDMVKNDHSIEDIKALRDKIKIPIMVRVNPFYERTQNEIDKAIKYGADIIMLPYFKDAEAVRRVADIVGARARFVPLVETIDAMDALSDIINIAGVDEIHIGLNDLSISMGQKFMFYPLGDGTVEKYAGILNDWGKPWGFGGVARIGDGLLKSEWIINEHIRLKSTRVILSRLFKNLNNNPNYDGAAEVRKIRKAIDDARRLSANELESNRLRVANRVKEIVSNL